MNPLHTVSTDRSAADAVPLHRAESPPPIADGVIDATREADNEISLDLYSLRNPLWIIAIAMACIFGMMVLFH